MREARSRWRDPRAGLGLAATAFFLWLTLRDVPFGEFQRAIAGTNWPLLLGLSVPSYVLTVYLRALRWRHLTDPVQSIGIGPLFRAVAVGFMANNIFPLRMGEVIRSWYLARESGAGTAAIFGTVILERVLDTVTVIGLAFAALAVWGAGGDGLIRQSALLLMPLAAAPIVVLAALKAAPERVIGLTAWLLRPFPERLRTFTALQLRGLSEGLGALSGGTHLLWIAWHSLSIWLVASTIPLIAGFLALGIDLGSPTQMLGAAWLTLAAIGVAVALPSAPGFFGLYHFACRIALLRFGVPTETAVALGTVLHALFWITLTALGFAVLRVRRTSLGEIDRAAGPSGRLPSR